MKNIKKMAILLMVLGVAVLTGRCVSDEAGSGQKIEQSIHVDQARAWFEQYQSKVKIDSSFNNQVYDWNSAVVEKFENGSEAIVVTVKDRNLSDAYKGQKLLYLYPSENKKEFAATLYEIIPSSESLEKIKSSQDLVNFNGYIIAWDLESGFVNGAKFENSNTTAGLTGLRVISPEEVERLNKSTAKSDPFELDEVIIRREKSENKQDYGGGGSAGGSYGGSLNSGSKGNSSKGYVKSPGGGGGGNGSSGSTTININIEGAKIDPKEETKCFDKSKSAVLTIYVQQPNENTRDKMGTNSVGHTFVGIQQGGIQRVLGFYPDSPNASLISSQKSELHDNSNTQYHVSISIEIDAGKLLNVISYINSYPKMYNLNNYNCSDFAIGVAAKGGLNLPKTTGTYEAIIVSFKGRNPGDLGQDIRDMSAPYGATINTTKGNAPKKKGGC